MVLAARGQRDLDDGPRAIDDEPERSALRRVARSVWLRTLALTGLGAILAQLL